MRCHLLGIRVEWLGHKTRNGISQANATTFSIVLSEWQRCLTHRRALQCEPFTESLGEMVSVTGVASCIEAIFRTSAAWIVAHKCYLWAEIVKLVTSSYMATYSLYIIHFRECFSCILAGFIWCHFVLLHLNTCLLSYECMNLVSFFFFWFVWSW